VLDGAIAVFSAVSGVQPQSETVWRQAERFGVPRLCFVNKMDQTGADFFRSVAMIAERLGAQPLVLQVPIGSAADFRGVIDLVSMTASVWEQDSPTPTVIGIPTALQDIADRYRTRMLEQVVETDDAAMAAYLNDEPAIGEAQMRTLIRKGFLAGRFTPVLCGSAYRNIGVQPLLDAIVAYSPAPCDRPPVEGIDPRTGEVQSRIPDPGAPLTALVSKIQTSRFGALAVIRLYAGRMARGMQVVNAATGRVERVGRLLRIHASETTEIDEAVAGDVVAVVGLKALNAGDTLSDPAHPIVLRGFECPEPVIEAVIEPRVAADQESLGEALALIAREDPSLRVSIDEETGQTLIRGMGELHLMICVEQLKETYNVDASIGAPRVAYREAITRRAEGEHTHRKQNGGVGQMARVRLMIEPLAPGDTGLVFENRVVGGAVPKQFVPSVEKALRQAMQEGGLAGCPVIGLKAALVDGAFHEKDSSGLAFELATREAFRTVFAQAAPVLLEPLMRVTVTTPGDHLGAIIGDLHGRRGSVLASDVRGNTHEVVALVPLANMFSYVNTLRSMSQGRATFTMRPEHYAPAPAALSAQIIAAGG
jgi:elongation factor G